MNRFAIVLFIAGMSFVAGCGSDDDAKSTPADTTTPAVQCVSPEQGESVHEYVGLDEDAAQELANGSELILRVVGIDGECPPITMDLRDDRVNVEIIDGVVVAAVMF